jgi:hypothetical protein
MRFRRHRLFVLATTATAVAATGAALGAFTPAESAVPTITVTPWLTGLNAPRGVAFDGNGHFYVAESGTAGSGDHGLTRTGRVKRFTVGSTTPRWTRAFTSLYAHEAPPPAPADVLGPEGMSAVVSRCSGARVHRPACQPRLIMSESNKGTHTTDRQVGRLYRLDPGTGRRTLLGNVGDQQWRWTKNHPNVAEPQPDANPYAVLVTRYPHRVRTFVVDAGANTLSEIMRGGRTRVIALLPNDTPKHDSAPTCVARGPDGMLYVGTLDLIVNDFGNNPGHSNVWRINPNASYPTKPRKWATGLTTITACTFDRAGNFWAAEMFAPNPSGPPGDLVRIPFKHPRRAVHLGLGQVPLPGGIAQGPGGVLYVSTNSAAPGPAGAVVRVRVR